MNEECAGKNICQIQRSRALSAVEMFGSITVVLKAKALPLTSSN